MGELPQVDQGVGEKGLEAAPLVPQRAPPSRGQLGGQIQTAAGPVVSLDEQCLPLAHCQQRRRLGRRHDDPSVSVLWQLGLGKPREQGMLVVGEGGWRWLLAWLTRRQRD